jgi:hypothetical protein
MPQRPSLFFSVNHVRAMVAGWVDDLNTARPHSAIGHMTPAAYVATLKAQRASALRHLESSAPMPFATVALTRNPQPTIPVTPDEQSGSRQSRCVWTDRCSSGGIAGRKIRSFRSRLRCGSARRLFRGSPRSRTRQQAFRAEALESVALVGVVSQFLV